jgi:hypothetical protein
VSIKRRISRVLWNSNIFDLFSLQSVVQYQSKESLILEDRVQFVFITVIAKMKKRRKNSSRMGLFATNDVKDSSEVRFSFVLN